MSKVRALLTPTLRAKLEVVLHQWAAAGMNNPDDPESPRGAADDNQFEGLPQGAELAVRAQVAADHAQGDDDEADDDEHGDMGAG